MDNDLFIQLSDIVRPEQPKVEEPITDIMDERLQKAINNIEFAAMRIEEIAKSINTNLKTDK